MGLRNKLSHVTKKWVHCRRKRRNRRKKYKYKFEIKEIKQLVNETFDFVKGTVNRVYKIKKLFYKHGILQKVKISFFTVVYCLGLLFGSSKPVEAIEVPPSQTQFERPLQRSDSTQADQAIKESESPSVRDLLKISGGELLGKPSNPGGKARADARNAVSSRANGGKLKSGVAEAWLQNPSIGRRPAAADHLAKHLQPGQPEGNNGLFGRFSARPAPDPYNPGCGGKPRSVTVLSNQSNPNSPAEKNVRTIKDHEGAEFGLTDRSLNHLTSNHGDTFGIDDQLPPAANQNPTKYPQVRTRINKENKQTMGDTLESILQDPTTQIFPNVKIRGSAGRGYYTPDYGPNGAFIGVATEGKLAGKIIKAQPVGPDQLKLLRECNVID